MSTIVTRTGKGSALTFTEGDANFTNLNADKLENINGESIGDLSDVSLGSNQYGSVTDVDSGRTPNTVTLTGVTLSTSTKVRFTGSDVTSAGLTVGTDYYIAASIGGNAYEISNTEFGGPISITDPGTITNFTYETVTTSSLSNGDILTWSGTNWAATTPTGGGGEEYAHFRIENWTNNSSYQIGGKYKIYQRLDNNTNNSGVSNFNPSDGYYNGNWTIAPGTYYIVGSGLTTKMDDVSLYDTNGNRVGHVYTLIQAAGFSGQLPDASEASIYNILGTGPFTVTTSTNVAFGTSYNGNTYTKISGSLKLIKIS